MKRPGLLVAAFLIFQGLAWAAGEPVEGLLVQSEPAGGLRARATLHLPAPPSAVQHILTDYERWPSLFNVTMRVDRVDRRPGLVLVDLAIGHPFLFGESRLVSENRELPEGGLVTSLLSGDFKRYHRVWKLSPDGSPAATRAEFELLVEANTWAPDWLVAFELRRQLEKHFHLLQRAVEKRAH
jgi:ribosome-associated toxin RatA of RatAB toxin-antitoxin module